MEGSLFQVDVILNSLRELQNEKGKNERILAEEFGKRKELEAELEEATSKHTVASENNAKVRDVVNVAEMKVIQIQDQVKMVEQVNDEKRESIRQLNQQIKELEQRKKDQLSSFETEMNTLTKKFRTAWDEFGDKALNTAMVECDRELETLSANIATSASYLDRLTSQLEQLQTKEQEEENTVEGIPTAMWEIVIDMFKVENEASLAALERKKGSLKVKELREKELKLAKQLEELEKRLADSTPNHEE